MIYVLPVNGLVNGKSLLTQAYLNKLKNSFLKENKNSDSHPKHLGLILYDIPNCKEHLKQKITQAHKGTVASRKLQCIV